MCIYKYIWLYVFYPLKGFAEISIWDPRLSLHHLAELTKYDYSKDVLKLIHPAVQKDKKTRTASTV